MVTTAEEQEERLEASLFLIACIFSLHFLGDFYLTAEAIALFLVKKKKALMASHSKCDCLL